LDLKFQKTAPALVPGRGGLPISRGNSKEFGLYSYAFLEGALEMGAPPQLSKNPQKVERLYLLNFSQKKPGAFHLFGHFLTLFFESLIPP
jgi:hypothetical protein